jgi:DNA-binding GntR family transcriptional regulator
VAELDTRSLVDRVYEHLLNQIITGSINYGDTINLKKVASELNISTMPVREAVKRLELERVVDIKPRSFCRVRQPSRRMVLEVYELREALELYAVEKCLGGMPAGTSARLHAIVEDMRSLTGVPDMSQREKRAIELDRLFHAEITALAGNDFLDAFYRQLILHVNMSLIHEKTYHALEEEYPTSHAEILRCLESDPPHAQEVLRRHFLNVKEILMRNHGASHEEPPAGGSAANDAADGSAANDAAGGRKKKGPAAGRKAPTEEGRPGEGRAAPPHRRTRSDR